MKNDQKKRFILVAAKVTFRDPEDAIGSTEVNAVTRLDPGNKRITVADIKKIHESTQLVFHSRVEDHNFQVVDILIQSITNLGIMTEDEFGGPSPEDAVSQLLRGTNMVN